MTNVRKYTFYQRAIVVENSCAKSMVINTPSTTDENIILSYIHEYVNEDSEMPNISGDDINKEWLNAINNKFIIEGTFLPLAWVTVDTDA